MKPVSPIAVLVAGLALSGAASAQVTFYENDGFQGRSFTTDRTIENFERSGFNDRASSVLVAGERSERWEVCEDRGFRGRCVVLRPGVYTSLGAMGLNNRISSVRTVDRNARVEDDRYPPVARTGPASQIVFYEREGMRGRSFTADEALPDFRGTGFNDRASSAVVSGERWEVCTDQRFGGSCVVLRRGEYPSLASMGLDKQISSARGVGRLSRAEDDRQGPQTEVRLPPPAPPATVGQIDFYENENYGGRVFTARTPVDDFRNNGFNDRASSAVVTGQPWQVCDDARFGGLCAVLPIGSYPNLNAMGLGDRISSARGMVADTRGAAPFAATAPWVARDYRRRDNERTYAATVTSVRAVVGDERQRCWVDPEQVAPDRRTANVPGALLGAVIGGILGHQVGGGSGRDVATGIGVVAGAAIGSNTGRGDSGPQLSATQNVQRCSAAPGQVQPSYWDVTYNFRGQDYRVQMTTPPGATINVNEQGEPRA